MMSISKRLSIIAAGLCLAAASNLPAEQAKSTSPAVLPTPMKQEVTKGRFQIDTGILSLQFAEGSKQNSVGQNITRLAKEIGFKNIQSPKGPAQKPASPLQGGGYTLEIAPKAITITATADNGFFYALQTLRQLVVDDYVPCQNIADKPRYAWRGLHLDVSRHFFDVDYIKRHLDLMALYKYNVFHWHLSDSDGWRIESKVYPKLHEVGAWRPRVGRPGNQAKGLNVDDGKRYGGYYTQDEIKEIIAYAKSLHIEILPEIDVPGHSKAIIDSYPELGASGDVLNVGKPETITFLEGIFAETAALFPFGYVHIGCDEVGLGAWKRHPDCQRKMKELGTDDPHVLHKWLVEHLQQFLAKKNKKAIAWCEVLDAKVDAKTAVMCWRDNGGWIKAPKLGHEIVVTPSMQAYFNYQEDVASNAPGHGGYRTIMSKVYNFDPTDDSLSEHEKKLVLGGQGCVWTEFIPLPKHVEYITFPRAVALSEALWTPKANKNWESFQNKLELHRAFMDKHKIQYRVGAPVPEARKIKIVGKTRIKLSNPNLSGTIHYTTDGSEPTASSPRYTDGIEVSDSCTIKSIVVLKNGRKSYVTSIECERKQAKAGVKLNNPQAGVHIRSYHLSDKNSGFVSMLNAAPTKVSISDNWSKVPGQSTHIEYNGYLKAEEAGNYTFFTQNHDQKLIVAGQSFTGNERNAEGVALAPGYHPFSMLVKGNLKATGIRYSNNGSAPKPVTSYVFDPSIKRNPFSLIDTNMQTSGNHKPELAMDGNNDSFFWSRHGVNPKHHFTVFLSQPKKAKSITVTTGKPNGGDKLEAGDLEVRYEGKDKFTKVADFTGGVATATSLDQAITAIRIKVIRPQGSWLVIREIEIQ